MASNVDWEFEDKLVKHFTAGELCEFLNIDIYDLLDKFDDLVVEYRSELEEEIS